MNLLEKYFGKAYSVKRNNTTFLVLMLASFSLAILYPVIMDMPGGVTIFQVVLTLVQLAGMLAVKTPNRRFVLIFALGVLSIVSNWLNFFYPQEDWASLAQMLFSLPFFMLITYQVIYFAMRSVEISPGIIFASVTGYLLLGVLGAWLNQLIETLIPGSFSIAHSSGGQFEDLLYFSYVSLSTVGYGDILPVSGAARSVAMGLGLTGQFYLAIIIAMLIGKYQATKEA